jgi:hypothetical protein
MDFEQKMIFLKTHKNSYTGPFYITDLKYGGHDHELQCFGQFLPQPDDLQ